MTVVNGEFDIDGYDVDRVHNGEPCTACGDPVYPPFVAWRCPGTVDCILICAECCQGMRAGLAADMIQVCAIMELRALGPNYRNTGLSRIKERPKVRLFRPARL
jgi:hypothetical protein